MAGRPLGLTNYPRELGEQKDPSTHQRGGPVRLERATRGISPDTIFRGQGRSGAPEADS